MEDNGTTLKTTNPHNQINSKSYIILECGKDGGKLQLRTEPPTYIELKAGKNILTVEKYPDLKYGFMPADYKETTLDSPSECDILAMDFKNFDSSEMTSMEDMFRGLEIKETDLEGLDTSHVCSMARTFMYSILPDNFKLNFNTENVTDISDMFHGWPNEKLYLSHMKVNKVQKISDIFFRLPDILILDGWKLNVSELQEYFIDKDYLVRESKIYARGCDSETLNIIIEDFTCEIEQGQDYINPKIITDNSIIEIKTLIKSDGELTNTNINRQFDICILSTDGKTLEGLNNYDIEFIAVPQNVEIISDRTFEGCENLHTVVLPNTLKVIGKRAFARCKKLKWINIPDSVVSIKDSAFENCDKLDSLYLGTGVKKLGRGVFAMKQG